MATNYSGRLVLVIVFLVGAASLVLYYTGATVPTIGATIMATSQLVQCDDTQTVIHGDVAYIDSVFVPSSVRTRSRTSRTASWSAWTIRGTDSCLGSTLTEWSCSSDGRAESESRTVSCPYGCSSGRCNLPACSDPDAGAAELTTGSVTTGLLLMPFGLGVPPRSTLPAAYHDRCLNLATIQEYQCLPLGSSTNRYVAAVTKPCSLAGPGFMCMDPYPGPGMADTEHARCGLCTPTAETCDGIDNDCDGYIDETLVDVEEICDDTDNNCNLLIDEGCDDDNDAYCDASMTYGSAGSSTCSGGSGDCVDTDTIVNPAAGDVCGNGVDENCDGVDAICPPVAIEICNRIDDNANSEIDEGCDDDNDHYCDADMVRADPYPTCSELDTNCCYREEVDCNDDVPFISPNSWSESCGDGVDSNCDGIDGVLEACNGFDDDCDLLIDDGLTCSLTCLDSDGGANPFMPGTVSGWDRRGEASSSDSCLDGSMLNETICVTYVSPWPGEDPLSGLILSSTIIDCSHYGRGCIDPDGPPRWAGGGLTGTEPAYCG